METDMVRIARILKSFDKRLASIEKRAEDKAEDKAEEKKDVEASGRDALMAEIASLEAKIASSEIKAEDVEIEDEDEDEDEEEIEASKKASKKASLVDRSGVEEKITQDYLTEVEELAHGDELTTDDSMLDAATTAYKKLRAASARLDAVADYLESTGRKSLAARVDAIADAIDVRANAIISEDEEKKDEEVK